MRRLQYLFVLLLLTLSNSAFANYQEGFDKQSPEEIESANKTIKELFFDAVFPQSLSTQEKTEILSKYSHLDPEKEVPKNLLEDAVLFFDKNKAKFPNQNYMTIVDFKKRSDIPRFFVINLADGTVEKFRAAHGWGSDSNDDGFAERFRNIANSGASSIGFSRTAEVYYGKFKRSLRLDGLSNTNSKIRERAIVVHGWDYIRELPEIPKLSWGCPALDWNVKDKVIDNIKEGSLFYMGISR